MNNRQKVLEQITEDEVVALAQKLVRIESYYGVPNVETAVAECICDYLRGEGIASEAKEIFEGRSNAYGTLEGTGTGKTHFVQGLAKGLGINDVVSSPTFTIMHYYEGEIPLKHFDFYRLDTEEDLYNIGWEEYSEGGVTVAEWADMFPGLIPERAIYIYLSNKGTTEREVKVIWGEEAPDAITKEIEKYASCH